MRTFSSKLSVSLLVLAVAVVPAAADDAKNYPGDMCLASGAAITRIERAATGRGMNLGPDVITLSCPAVKDFGGIASAKVHVIDENPASDSDGGDLSCTLRSRNLTGSEDTETHGTEELGAGFQQSLPVALPSFHSMQGNAVGYYFFYCTVPAPAPATGLRSGVVTYQVTEAD